MAVLGTFFAFSLTTQAAVCAGVYVGGTGICYPNQPHTNTLLEGNGSGALATTSIPLGINLGGTGTTSTPTLGQILIGDNNGNYEFVASSTFGGTVASVFSTTTTRIWIDSNRTDTYTPDGSIFRPYKTIVSAIQTFPATYVIEAGTYIEPALSFTATSTIEGDQATIIVIPNGNPGGCPQPGNPFSCSPANISFATGVILDNVNVVLGNVFFNDHSLSDPSVLENSFVNGNVDVYGLSIANGGELEGGVLYTGTGSLTNFSAVDVLDQVQADGTFNLNDANFQVNVAGYALVSSSSPSTIAMNGISLENTNANGGGIQCNNGAGSTPNTISNITFALGTTTNTAVVNCGLSSNTSLGVYTAVSSTNGANLKVPPSENETTSFSFASLNIEGTALFGVNGGNVGINATTSPGAWLSIADSAGASATSFLVSTSTSAFATSTAVEIDGTGNLYLLNGSNLTLSNLGTAGGSFLAVNASGKVIATSTPSGSTNYFTNSGAITTLSTGSQLDVPSNGWFGINNALFAYASTTNEDTILGLNAGGNTSTTSPTLEQYTTIGYRAGGGLTTGGNDTAVGAFALASTTTGGGLTAVGQQTLMSNTTGASSAAIGFSALLKNTTGSGNMAMGNQTLEINTTGSDNIAIGTDSLESQTNGDYNISIGNTSGLNTTGYDDIAIGGNQNVNGSSLTSGNNDVLIGLNAEPPTATTNNFLNFDNVFYATGLATSTQTTAVPNGADVGVASTSPAALLAVMVGGGYASQASSYGFLIGSSTAGNATSTLFSVNSAGLVSVGTTSPAAAIDIDTSVASATPLLIEDSSSLSTGGCIIIKDVAGTGYTQLYTLAGAVLAKVHTGVLSSCN